MMLRTIQVIVAALLVAGAIIGSLWVLGVIDPTEAKTSMAQIGGVLGICLVAALVMMAVFSIGTRNNEP